MLDILEFVTSRFIKEWKTILVAGPTPHLKDIPLLEVTKDMTVEIDLLACLKHIAFRYIDVQAASVVGKKIVGLACQIEEG